MEQTISEFDAVGQRDSQNHGQVCEDNQGKLQQDTRDKPKHVTPGEDGGGRIRTRGIAAETAEEKPNHAQPDCDQD
jgi:hypothetical protein